MYSPISCIGSPGQSGNLNSIYIGAALEDRYKALSDIYSLCRTNRKFSLNAFRLNDMAPKGFNWAQNTQQNVDRADSALLYLSANYLKSPYCIQELNIVSSSGLPMVVVSFEECKLPDWSMNMTRKSWIVQRQSTPTSTYYDRLSQVLSETTMS